MLLTWEDLKLFKDAIRDLPAHEHNDTLYVNRDAVLATIEEVARGYRPPQS